MESTQALPADRGADSIDHASPAPLTKVAQTGVRTAERSLFAVAVILFFGIAATYAFYIVFSRQMSPDEGYLMITVQSFIEGNALYDSVFTHYGPFYYAYEWVIHSLLSIPLTVDATRLLCILHWLTAAALLGCAGGIMMRSVFAGLFVFAQATIHLATMANEPGHPQELIVALVASGILIPTQDPKSHRVFGLLAIISAALLFTKINIGVFSGLALVLAMRCHIAGRLAPRAWHIVASGICAMLPFLLMRPYLAEEWCRNYSLITACAIFTTLLWAGQLIPRRHDSSPSPPNVVRGEAVRLNLSSYSSVAAVFFASSALLCAIVLCTGTTIKGLVDGLFLTPLKMPGVALLPLPLNNLVLVNAAAAMVTACIVYRLRNSTKAGGVRMESFINVLKSCYGITGCFCLLGDAKSQLGWLLPWVWLLLVPPNDQAGRGQRTPLLRTFLGLTAAWQSLQAYPIAGTQVTTATFVLVLTYALCLRDAWQAFVVQPLGCQSRKPIENLARLFSRNLRWAQALAFVGLLYLFANHWCNLVRVRREYADLPPLGLPGSRYVHMDAETTETYGTLVQYLATECDCFVTYPGVNSLYFWTGQRPPTHLNSTGWGPLTHQQQGQILTKWRQARRPMLVVVSAAADGWLKYAPPQLRPLIRCVFEDCREVKRIGGFVIFVPK